MSPPALVGVIKAVPRAIEGSSRLAERLDPEGAARGLAAALESMMDTGTGLCLELDGAIPVRGRWNGRTLEVVIEKLESLRGLLLPVARRLSEDITLGVDEPVEILLLFEIWRPFLLALSKRLDGSGTTVLLSYRDLVLVRIGHGAEPVLSERYGKTEVYMSHLFKLLSDLFG